MSTWSEYNPYRNGRGYVFAFPSHSETQNKTWEYNGTRRKHLWNDNKLSSSIQKALSGDYTHFVVSDLVLNNPGWPSFFKQIQDSGLKTTLQIDEQTNLNLLAPFLQKDFLQIEWWVNQRWPQWDTLRELSRRSKVSLKILGVHSNSALERLHEIPPDFLDSTEFYFPYFLQKKQKWKPREIMSLSEKLRKSNADFLFRPASGIDIYEPRIHEQAELEPCHPPLYQSHKQLSPKISVVIPVYNNGFYLLNTLRHLEQQGLAKDLYEIIIVDDGSSDRLSEDLVSYVQDFQMPTTVLYYPRLKKRQMGDSQFRAGLARNYGVKFARGEYLVFLDSDILTPPDFLSKTLVLHEKNQVVQWRRDYLGKNVPCANISYGEVDAQKHCYIPERGYWHNFYAEAKDKGWSQIPDGWKYACTYAFSLPKNLFKQAGWFRKTFCFYGLEDTDLGWRLFNSGARFHLEATPVYHLFHENVRSEFFNSSYRRQKLLKTTSEIFFYNNLSPDIYRVFQYLLNSWIY